MDAQGAMLVGSMEEQTRNYIEKLYKHSESTTTQFQQQTEPIKRHNDETHEAENDRLRPERDLFRDECNRLKVLLTAAEDKARKDSETIANNKGFQNQDSDMMTAINKSFQCINTKLNAWDKQAAHLATLWHRWRRGCMQGSRGALLC